MPIHTSSSYQPYLLNLQRAAILQEYNDNRSTEVNELYAQPRRTLPEHFFKPNDNGSSVADQILNQTSLTINEI